MRAGITQAQLGPLGSHDDWSTVEGVPREGQLS